MSKVQRSRLGRGLSSLISPRELPVEVEVAPPKLELNPPPLEVSAGASDGSAPPASNGSPLEIPLDQIQPNPHQPRKSLDEATVSALAASVKSSGVIQPVVVRKDGNGYQLIAGERRWRAAKLAGLKSVPAIIREATSVEQAQLALIENIQREDLNPIDRAASYRTLIDQLGLTQAELAARLGEDRSGVANYLRLLDLTEPVREMVRIGRLSLGHAKLLAGIDDPVEQLRLANLVTTQELSVRNLERLIASSGQVAGVSDTRPTSPTTSAHIQDLERSIARQLGMRVQLRPSARKGHGKLILHYASLDQFDGVLAKLGIQTD